MTRQEAIEKAVVALAFGGPLNVESAIIMRGDLPDEVGIVICELTGKGVVSYPNLERCKRFRPGGGVENIEL